MPKEKCGMYFHDGRYTARCALKYGHSGGCRSADGKREVTGSTKEKVSRARAMKQSDISAWGKRG